MLVTKFREEADDMTNVGKMEFSLENGLDVTVKKDCYDSRFVAWRIRKIQTVQYCDFLTFDILMDKNLGNQFQLLLLNVKIQVAIGKLLATVTLTTFLYVV